jgi:electron transfer flavoprotein alpha subunit
MKILVFSDKISNYPELCAGAGLLGSEASAFVVGSQADAEAAAQYVSKVYYSEAGNRMVEDFLETFKNVIDSENPQMVLIRATKRGKCIAGRLAASLNTSVLTDLSDIRVEGDSVVGVKMYYGGLALNTLKSMGTAIVTVGAGAFEPVETAVNGTVIPVDFVEGNGGIVRKEIRKKEGETVNLAAAKRVVSAGRGIASKEDLSIVEQLAASIRGEVGCTRPIAEGEGWMSASRYIGVSGVVLKPDVYIAVGVSGQIQHMIGVNSSKVIIAINKDKNAPIFKNCDYGIVGDLYKIVPALTELIKQG